MDVKVGNRIEVRSTQVGQPVRQGEVREVVSTDPLELRVAWDDGHESNFYPAAGMTHVVTGSGSA